MQNGIDLVLTSPFLDNIKSLKIALVTNNAAKSADGLYSRNALLENGFNIVKLFSPEHGLSTQGIDGEAQKDIKDDQTGLPVLSLYGNNIKPSIKDLMGIDIVLFDIPDVGCRFYTYLWTLTYVMEACAEFGIKLIILDRPNPIGIDLSKSEGPYLDEEVCSSFIGRWSIPIRHSCTLGELAVFFKSVKTPALDLEIIKVKDYSRLQNSHVTITPWTPPSPAIRSQISAYLYPGLGLLEGINVNEGRGTENPFTICGAPFIDSKALMNELNLDGVEVRSIEYIPSEGLYAHEKCQGIKFTNIQIESIMPVSVGLQLIKTMIKLYPEFITPRLYKTNVNPTGENHLDRLIGLPGTFEKLSKTFVFETNIQKDWTNKIVPYQLY